MKHLEAFFDYARARHQVYLNRRAGMPQKDWTKDPILQRYRFTNVFREYDKTTAWFAKNFRQPFRDKPEVLMGTVVFRMLNRIEVGEAIFCQNDMFSKRAAFFDFLDKGDVRILRKAIRALVPNGPYVTGAYIISSPPGYNKLDGMLEVIKRFYKQSDWETVSRFHCSRDESLQSCFDWISQYDYFGKFHSYEIVTDLRHTRLLEHAPDVMTWANIGPGCRRGMSRILWGRKQGPRLIDKECLEYMTEILACSTSSKYWPQPDSSSSGEGSFDRRIRKNMERDWPRWEMREVEHTLCEFDKYQRVKKGEGKPRGVFK